MRLLRVSGGILVCRALQAAAVAVVCSLAVSLIAYRSLSLREMPAMLLWAASMSAAIMMVIATANVGCQLHLATRPGPPVRHWIELVDEALP